MSPPIVADTGGLLRGLASTRDGKPSFPEYEKVLTSASLVIVPGLVLAEVDYFLRENRVISYSRTDREFVNRLVQDLASRNLQVDVFYDMLLPAGSSWVETLAREIEKADVILAVLSPDYLKSDRAVWDSPSLMQQLGAVAA